MSKIRHLLFVAFLAGFLSVGIGQRPSTPKPTAPPPPPMTHPTMPPAPQTMPPAPPMPSQSPASAPPSPPPNAVGPSNVEKNVGEGLKIIQNALKDEADELHKEKENFKAQMRTAEQGYEQSLMSVLSMVMEQYTAFVKGDD